MKFLCLPYKYELELSLSFNQKKPENFRQKSAVVQKLWQKTIFFKSGPKRLRQLPSKVPFECDLFSCDITSLYSLFLTNFGIEAIQYWIEQERNMIPSHFTNNFILDNLKFILTNIINYLVEQWEQSVLHHLHV